MARFGGWSLTGKGIGNGFGRRGRGKPVDYYAIAREREGGGIPTDLQGRPITSGQNAITGEPTDRWIKPKAFGRYGNKLPRKY